jgi:hypothetical protein
LLGAEEAVKHVLNVFDMALIDVSASLKVISEYRLTNSAHHPQLLAPIRQVFQRR